jgi:hypothetical protein
MLGLHQRTSTRYLETREDREAITKADNAEWGPRFVKGKASDEDSEEVTPPVDVEAEPEFASVESFAEFCMDDDRDSFTFGELQKLRETLLRSPGKIVKDLAGYGLRYEGRAHEKAVRGFTSSPYTLYAGNPMCGGSGFTHDGPGAVRR